MTWDSDAGMGWWMLMGSVWFVLFWGIVIWAVVRLTSHREPHDQRSALHVARHRYASGQLGREEFEQIRKDLTT